MSAVPWRNAIDFGALAIAFYLLLRWSRGARALRLGIAIVGLRVAAFLTNQLDLPVTSSLLEAARMVALLALVLIVQPELRRGLMRLDIAGRAHRARGLSRHAAREPSTHCRGPGPGHCPVVRRVSISWSIRSSPVPFGIHVEGITPKQVNVRLATVSPPQSRR